MTVELLRKRYDARGQRHDGECYHAVVASDGQAHAWLRVHGKRESLIYRGSPDGVERVAVENTYIFSPLLLGGHLLWVQSSDGGWSIHAMDTSDPQHVRQPFDLPGRPLSLGGCEFDGSAALVWEQREGCRTRVYIATQREGDFGQAHAVSDGTANAYDPDVAICPDGSVFVAYSTFAGGHYRVVLQKMAADGTRAGAPQRLSNRAEACLYPSISAATGGGVWFSYTSLSEPVHVTDLPLVQHHRFQAQKDIFRKRGIVQVGWTDGEHLRAVAAPRGKPLYTAAMLVDGSGGASRTRVFEDARGRVRLLLRQYAPWSEARYAHEDEPLRRNAVPNADLPSCMYANLSLMTLCDDNWTQPVTLINRAHIELPISCAMRGDTLTVAFTEDARRVGWDRAGEWFDSQGQLGVGGAELRLSDLGTPDYDFRDFTLSPVIGPSVENPRVDARSGPFLHALGQTHKHSTLSICCRELDRDMHMNFRVMQDVQHCLFGALTDHDYNMWHTEMLLMRKHADYYYFPSEFVALQAYEWTGSDPAACSHEGGPFGHMNPLCFDEHGDLEVYAAGDPKSPGGSPQRLWNSYEGQPIITPPHHMVDSVHRYYWQFMDPDMATVVELFQDGRGSTEQPGAPGVTNSLHHRQAQWVVDALKSGKRFGFIAGGEHVGLALAGVLTRELTRTGLYEAMRARRTFATTGLSIRVRLVCNDTELGGALKADVGNFSLEVASPEPARAIHVMRNGDVWQTYVPGNESSVRHAWTAHREEREEFWYCRVIFGNGDMAWTSPIWLSEA